MITLKQLETKHHFSYPALYKALFEADKLNWMRDFNEPLPKGKTWAENVYPTLKEWKVELLALDNLSALQ